MTSTQDKGTIMIVDDTPANQRVLAQMLLQAGYRVRVMHSGANALRSIAVSPPDLILLDVMMPEMSGYQVCRALKADGDRADIPVIFLSALDAAQDKIEAFAAGGVDYVTKPFQPEEVLARINAHVALRDLQRGLEREIAERDRLIAERDQLIAELDAFAHTVAHDLKNPLQVIVGSSAMLRDLLASPTPDQAWTLEAIQRTGAKMSNIAEELMLLSGVRKTCIAPEPIDMGEIIVSSLQRLDHLIAQTRAQIKRPDSWPAAAGYPPWIEEVWTNYVSNACKYGGSPPRIELGYTMRTGDSPCTDSQRGSPSAEEHAVTPATIKSGCGITATEFRQRSKPVCSCCSHDRHKPG